MEDKLIAEKIPMYELESLLSSIHKHYGYDFSGYAKSSMKRRITRFMLFESISNMKELQKHLIDDEKFFATFLEEITVSVTEMFRDPTFYKSLRKKIVPILATYPYIKIWNAGCSTGEEVYSMAILMHEAGLYHKTKIYGTDINQRDLAKAKAGIFPIEYMQEYTTNYINSGGNYAFSTYYIAKYKGAIINHSLKNNLVFAVHNLVNDRSFNEFNLIVCRNVLIYFNKNLQNHVIKLFYDSLCMFGYLALGSKESLLFSDYKNKFEIVDEQERIYRKIK